jgi:uncharacterized protein with HEPN domain
MPRDPRAWLTDIVAACDLLVNFTRDKSLTDYTADALSCGRPWSVSSRSSARRFA